MAMQSTEKFPPFAPLPDSAVIVDCTSLPRFGLRGPGSCEWLLAQGFAIPETVNRATLDDTGNLALRLGRNEAVISGFASGPSSVKGCETAWSGAADRQGYNGFRQDSWTHLLISGPRAADLMAEITETDLRIDAMPAGIISQTRALKIDAIIVRTDRLGTFGYELFFDIASRAYVCETLRGLAPDYGFSVLPSTGAV